MFVQIARQQQQLLQQQHKINILQQQIQVSLEGHTFQSVRTSSLFLLFISYLLLSADLQSLLPFILTIKYSFIFWSLVLQLGYSYWWLAFLLLIMCPVWFQNSNTKSHALLFSWHTQDHRQWWPINFPRYAWIIHHWIVSLEVKIPESSSLIYLLPFLFLHFATFLPKNKTLICHLSHTNLRIKSKLVKNDRSSWFVFLIKITHLCFVWILFLGHPYEECTSNNT